MPATWSSPAWGRGRPATDTNTLLPTQRIKRVLNQGEDDMTDPFEDDMTDPFEEEHAQIMRAG